MFSTIYLDNLKPDEMAGYQEVAVMTQANSLWITFARKKSSMISMFKGKNLGKVLFS
jgi:hypothetical protein